MYIIISAAHFIYLFEQHSPPTKGRLPLLSLGTALPRREGAKEQLWDDGSRKSGEAMMAYVSYIWGSNTERKMPPPPCQ